MGLASVRIKAARFGSAAFGSDVLLETNGDG